MYYKHKLAIAIPTYNRSEILKDSLQNMLEFLIRYSIPVYISDDSNDNKTKDIVDEHIKKYPLIYYHKNEKSLGHDLNCIATLLMANDANYVWYLGDAMMVDTSFFESLVNLVNKSVYDFIFLNSRSRNLHVASTDISNDELLLQTFGWHLTMTGATIYRQNTLTQLKTFKPNNYESFPQCGIIYEYFFYNKNASALWYNEKVIYGNSKKKNNWKAIIFKTFLTDLKNLFTNIPQQLSAEKIDAIVLKHSTATGVYSYFNLLIYRANKVYNSRVFKQYKRDLEKYTYTNLVFLTVLAYMPSFFVTIPYHFILKLRAVISKTAI